MTTNVVFLGVVVIGFSKYQNVSISQPIGVKLRLQVDDSILHNRTVSDFQVKS